MSKLTVTPQIDDHVVLECLAILQRELGDEHARFRVIAVHVEDRGFGHFGDVGAVRPAVRVSRIRRETDLVVDDDVYRSADRVTVEIDHVQTFSDDALPRKRRVAVKQDRHALFAFCVVANALLGARSTQDHRPDKLQVRWIGRKRQPNRLAGHGDVI